MVVLGYAPVPDITRKVTPDIKMPSKSMLGLIDLGLGKNRLGGSALAQAFNQLGNETPDVDDPKLLKNAFLAAQKMINEGLILALHDRSDGGLITAVAEMCLASRCGFSVSIPDAAAALANLFGEELGFVIELEEENRMRIWEVCNQFNIPIDTIGFTLKSPSCRVNAMNTGEELFRSTTMELRCWWEATSAKIEELQITLACAEEESRGHQTALPGMEKASSYQLSFTPEATPLEILNANDKPALLGGITVSQALLSPTRQWPILIRALIVALKHSGDFHLLHGISLNSGGGATKILHVGRGGIVYKKDMPEPPSIFRLIQIESGEKWRDMYQSFNCGVGLDVVGADDPRFKQTLEAVSVSSEVKLYELGVCQASSDGANHVALETPYGRFDDY